MEFSSQLPSSSSLDIIVDHLIDQGNHHHHHHHHHHNSSSNNLKKSHHRRCSTDPSLEDGFLVVLNDETRNQLKLCLDPIQRSVSACSLFQLDTPSSSTSIMTKLDRSNKAFLVFSEEDSTFRLQRPHRAIDTRDDETHPTTTKSPPRLGKAVPDRHDLLPSVLKSLETLEWNLVLQYLEQDPSLVKRPVSMICQGETSKCLLIHLVCGRKHTPLTVMDTLVTLYPSSLLLATESCGNRLPIHLALIKGASYQVIEFLCQGSPQALKHADQDGNLPLHYATMFASSDMIKLVLRFYPEACQHANRKGKYPLHLLCSRCYSLDIVSGLDIEQMLRVYPEACTKVDSMGRTPLHCAAHNSHVQWDLMEPMIRNAPHTLLLQDKTCQTPLQLAKNSYHQHPNEQQHHRSQEHHNGYDLVISCLTECTLRERRKQSPYLPTMFLLRSGSVRRRTALKRKCTSSSSSNADLYHCYG